MLKVFFRPLEMPSTALPEEVLETIILVLHPEDILNFLTVLGKRGSEWFWKKVCYRNGYRRVYGAGQF